MSRKQIITKEQILKSASEILIENGMQQITARNVAKKLGCSTQPIYWYYKNIQDVLHDVYLCINKHYIHEMMCILVGQEFFIEMTKWLMDIVKRSSYLFDVLFNKNGYDDENLFDVMRSLVDNKEIISKLKVQYELGDNGARYLYNSCSNILWPSVRLIRQNDTFKDDNQFIEFITSFFSDFVRFAKPKD